MSERERPPLVISVQSQVVHGHVGNSAAVFPMQAAGLEVAAIPTVIFSNTPDYPTLRGGPISQSFFLDLVRGAEERGLPERAAYLLSGYIGSVEVARLLAEFVARSKEANPDLIYICDPVMGDHAPGLYVPPEIAAVMQKELLPLADIATPNTFELAHLSGISANSVEELQQAAASIQLAADARLIVTGARLTDTPDGQLESVLMTPGGLSRFSTPHIPVALPGTGDLFTGLVVAALARKHALPEAINLAQRLTGLALEYARTLGAREVVLSEPRFRRALLDL